MDAPHSSADARAPLGLPEFPKIYFARAMDGIDETVILTMGRQVAQELEAHNLGIIDPFVETPRYKLAYDASDDDGRLLVEADLLLLRKSDGVLMDMSMPMRNYIGCVCELTYAFLWRIPTVVYVGRSNNGKRHWLRYHADGVCESRREAIGILATLVAAQGGRR